MKYTKKILILAIMLIAVGTHKAYATSGSVTTDGVRMRKSPSTEAEIITILNESAQVEILEESGDWYKVKYTWNGTYEGYMSKQFIKTDGSEISSVATPTPQETTTSTPETETPQPQETLTPEETLEPEVTQSILLGENVTNSETKLYVFPTVSSSVKETIKSNSTVIVKELAGKFAYVKYNDEYGWVFLSLLKQQTVQTTSEQDTTPANTEKIGYVNVTQAIVRTKATTSSEMVTALNLNSEVTIIGEEGDFYKIKIDGKDAYIAKRLISDTPQTTSRSSEPRNTEVESQVEISNEPTSTIENENKTTQTTDVATPATSSVGEQIAEMAKEYVGYKYVYGGASPSTGFDCSGLVYYICGKLGYSVNRTADYQINNGVSVEKANLQPGDLVFFTNYSTNEGIGHVGIYIGNNQFVHASSTTTGVIISSLNQADYVRRYVTARRIGV